MSRVFTIGQVAMHCKVPIRTASKWFDSKQLKGYAIPGSLDRRVPERCLIEFMEARGMPLDGLKREEST